MLIFRAWMLWGDSLKKLMYVKASLQKVWSDETTASISELLEKKHSPFLEGEEFLVESGRNLDQIQIQINLRKKDGSIEYPIECVYPVDSANDRDPSDVAYLMLDYLDVYWHEYLSDGRDTFFPIDWSKHTCEGVEFFVRGFVRNVKLEREAEKLFEEEGYGDHVIEKISSES